MENWKWEMGNGKWEIKNYIPEKDKVVVFEYHAVHEKTFYMLRMESRRD